MDGIISKKIGFHECESTNQLIHDIPLQKTMSHYIQENHISQIGIIYQLRCNGIQLDISVGLFLFYLIQAQDWATAQVR